MTTHIASARIFVVGILSFAALISILPAQEGTRGEALARVDVQAIDPRMVLDSGVAIPNSATIGRMEWLEKATQPGTYSVHFPIVSYANSPAEFRFVPDQNGSVGVWLRGPWQEPTKYNNATPAAQFLSPSISGAVIKQSQNRFPIATSHDNPAYLEIEVIAGQAVEISVQAKSLEPDRQSNSNPSSIRNQHAFESAKRFQRGINLAQWLEIPEGADWGESITYQELALIRDEGFDHIRLPVNWHEYCGPGPDYSIYPTRLRQVDQVIQQAESLGLSVVINECNNETLMVDPLGQTEKMVRIWQQLASYFRDHEATIAYELVNEPSDNLINEQLNHFNATLVNSIRKIDSQRPIMISPSLWAKVEGLSELQVPPDDNLIVQIHLYEPFNISHIQAPWVANLRYIRDVEFPGPPRSPVLIPSIADEETRDWLQRHNTLSGRWNPASEFEIEYRLQLAAAWGKSRHVPIYLGEFGAITRLEPNSRQRYLSSVRRIAESLHIGWAMWDWKSTFAYYNSSTREVRPEIREALFGQ